MEPVTQISLLRRLPSAVGSALRAIARWYWGLPLIGQFFAAAILVPLTSIGLAKVGIEPHTRKELTLYIGVALVGTMIVATLVHGTDGKRED